MNTVTQSIESVIIFDCSADKYWAQYSRLQCLQCHNHFHYMW